jgi:hypothetical protein
MRRVLVVAFAVFAAVVVATGQPAAAANVSGQLAVASKHTTNSDFNSATTLTNVTVQNNNVLLNSSTGDPLVTYGGDTGVASVVSSPVYDGSQALEMAVSTNNHKVISDTDTTVAQGDTIAGVTQAQVSPGEGVAYWGTQGENGSSSISGYRAAIRSDNDDVVIQRVDSGSATNLATPSVSMPMNEWLEWEVDWQTDGDMVFALRYASNGTQILSTTVTDSTYTSGGVGFGAYADSAYHDDVRINGNQVEGFESGSGVKPSGQYVSAGDSAEDIEKGFANLTLKNASATVEWWTDTDDDGTFESVVNSSTYTSSGNKTLGLDTQYDDWRVNVTFQNDSGSPTTAKLHDEGVLFDARAPSGTNADPAGNTTSYDGDIALDVSDPDFALAQGDSVTVTASDSGGTQIGSATVSSNQTVTFAYSAKSGANDITWTLTDAYGHSTTVSQQFRTPATFSIRNETDDDHSLVTTSSTLRIRFYADGTVVEKTTTDGTVNMTGLPAGEEFVVIADPDGYYPRRVVITSLFEQQTMYVLDENETAVENRFVLNDRSGEFPATETRLRISRPITNGTTGNTTYKQLAGDELGASGEFVTNLEKNVRYRIRVENVETGATRVVGAYVATRNGTVSVSIDRVVYPAPEGEAIAATAERTEVGGSAYAIFRFNDPSANTSELTVQIHERGNASNVVFESTYTDVSTLHLNESLPSNSTEYVINMTAIHDGRQISSVYPLVRGYGVGLPIAQAWLGSIVLVLLVFVTSLYQARLASFGALVCVFVAGGAMLLQWITINPFAWWGAAAVATLGYISDSSEAIP